MNVPHVRIAPWGEGDLGLLRSVNTPQMKRHVGGPETDEQVIDRHQRYLDIAATGRGRMFSIIALPEFEAVGTIGYWERLWQEETVYEVGWNVLPLFQGRGIAAAAAAAAVDAARGEQKWRYLHAFPGVDNLASNAICRKVGFSFIAECDFEYPPGSFMRSNNWSLDLTGVEAGAGSDRGTGIA
ncbi:GNAT family N-acetyltransferase [Streptomyces chumphonensis]|uniref:GNAT family N-acetyltransferase n=1 Tax=Streptomyces chumphonensis TaxID=1214925 RepID=A0A927EZG1_9ACTN|nr:GNAT family N-acetyltransferase [Streptomyces chumphonensis]MBD3932568.1 GNAT family N-acetyltransferase [Streptomyces chumphonensis]